MALQTSYSPETFRFSFNARTSRGLMKDKLSWFVKLWDDTQPGVAGLGESGPLPGLSTDDRPDFETVLADVLAKLPHHISSQDLQGPASLDNPVLQKALTLVPEGYP